MLSKSVTIFLLDGTAMGRVKCTMQNWTGVAYKIPRNMLDTCKESKQNTTEHLRRKLDITDHLKQTGIYFLLGENNDGDPAIYVGQAGERNNGEALLQRLLEHQKNEKESYWNDWNEVIVFTTQNNILGATEISFLEHRFFKLASSAQRYALENGNLPPKGNLTEEKECEMEEFIEYARIIMGVLGHKVFEPIIEQKPQVKQELVSENEAIMFNFKGNIEATATITNEGFVVLRGSHLGKPTPKCPFAVLKNRKKYDSKIDENRILLADAVFKSSSAAASFVAGNNRSGNACWRTKDGKPPKDYGM